MLVARTNWKKNKEKAAADAATAWLALVDSGQYGESWFPTASVFRNAVSKEQWTITIRSGRAPLGDMGTRQIKSPTFTTKLPNVVAGEYVVLQFETSFTKQKLQACSRELAELNKERNLRHAREDDSR